MTGPANGDYAKCSRALVYPLCGLADWTNFDLGGDSMSPFFQHSMKCLQTQVRRSYPIDSLMAVNPQRQETSQRA